MTFNFFIATVKLVIKAETDKNLNKDECIKKFLNHSKIRFICI